MNTRPADWGLERADRDLLAALRTATPGDAAIAERVEATLLAALRAGAYARALALGRESAATLGYHRLAASELLPMIALGDLAGARTLASELAIAPADDGGHGLRAIVRTLLGRDADAARDGMAFVEEAERLRTSLAAWRKAARCYGPATAQVLSRYAHLHDELARSFGSRRWTGEPVASLTIVVQLVEGLGDNLQGLRFATALRAEGARVLVGCDERLHPLVRAAGAADGFIERPVPRAHGYGPADYHVVIGGWLHEAAVPVERWPTGAPYLRLPPEAPPTPLADADAPRVGIAWAGNPDFALEGARGLPGAALRRLVRATPNVTWVSLLQPDHPRGAELHATRPARHLVDAGASLGSMLDTARLLARLDLAVTTDTAVAHLAGALGVPTRLLLGRTFNWRWRLDGATTPLYASMRLVRDGVGGDWNAAVDRVARELDAWRAA